MFTLCFSLNNERDTQKINFFSKIKFILIFSSIIEKKIELNLTSHPENKEFVFMLNNTIQNSKISAKNKSFEMNRHIFHLSL